MRTQDIVTRYSRCFLLSLLFVACLAMTAQVCYADSMQVDLQVIPPSVDAGMPVSVQMHVNDSDHPELKFKDASLVLTISFPSGARSNVTLYTDANGNRDYQFMPMAVGSYSFQANGSYNYTAAGFTPAGNQSATSPLRLLTVVAAPTPTPGPTPVPTPVPADSVAPATTLTIAGMAGSSGEYSTSVTFTLIAQDNANGSGVKATQYSFDGSVWNNYTSPLVLNKSGTTTLYYRSIDNDGNVEATQVKAITISSATATPAPGPSAAAAVASLAVVAAWLALRRPGKKG